MDSAPDMKKRCERNVLRPAFHLTKVRMVLHYQLSELSLRCCEPLNWSDNSILHWNVIEIVKQYLNNVAIGWKWGWVVVYSNIYRFGLNLLNGLDFSALLPGLCDARCLVICCCLLLFQFHSTHCWHAWLCCYCLVSRWNDIESNVITLFKMIRHAS